MKELKALINKNNIKNTSILKAADFTSINDLNSGDILLWNDETCSVYLDKHDLYKHFRLLAKILYLKSEYLDKCDGLFLFHGKNRLVYLSRTYIESSFIKRFKIIKVFKHVADVDRMMKSGSEKDILDYLENIIKRIKKEEL